MKNVKQIIEDAMASTGEVEPLNALLKLDAREPFNAEWCEATDLRNAQDWDLREDK